MSFTGSRMAPLLPYDVSRNPEAPNAHGSSACVEMFSRGQRMRPLGSITGCPGSSPMVSAPSAELSASVDPRLDSGHVVTLHVNTIVPS